MPQWNCSKARARRPEAAKKGLQKKLLRCAGSSVTLGNVTVSNTSGRPLTELQQAILDFIWAEGPATADQVRESLGPDHPLKDSTVRTLLRRLEAQGYLTHRLEGKSFLYQAAEPASSHAVRTVRQLIERFWAGSAEQFVVGMVDAKVLPVETLRRLARKVQAPK